MPRTSNTELPSAGELWEILAKESPRTAVHYDYLKLHPEVFSPFKELCRRYDAECDWVDQYKRMDLVDIDARLRACFDTLEASILSRSDPLYERVYDQLVINGVLESADAIFVFGSPNDLRIKKAVELYNSGFSKKIVISGHGPFYARHTQSEAGAWPRRRFAKGSRRQLSY